MSHIHFKMRSSKDLDTLTFDGLSISLPDLKQLIMTKKNLSKNDREKFDLQVCNAQTNEPYKNEDFIPKNSSVIVARIPMMQARKPKTWQPARPDPTASGAVPVRAIPEAPSVDKTKSTKELYKMEVSEEVKIAMMQKQSTDTYDKSNYITKPNVTGQHRNMAAFPPRVYVCNICGKSGHWIFCCPNKLGDNPPVKNNYIKASTGIPSIFMTPVDDPNTPGALRTSAGTFAVPTVNKIAYDQGKKEKPPFVRCDSPEPADDEKKVPDELLCSICHNIVNEAVVIPCCGNSFCDECIRQTLLDSDDRVCPHCHESGISPDGLVANKFLRSAVVNYLNENSYIPNRAPRPAVPTAAKPDAPVAQPIKQEIKKEIKQETVHSASPQYASKDSPCHQVAVNSPKREVFDSPQRGGFQAPVSHAPQQHLQSIPSINAHQSMGTENMQIQRIGQLPPHLRGAEGGDPMLRHIDTNFPPPSMNDFYGQLQQQHQPSMIIRHPLPAPPHIGDSIHRIHPVPPHSVTGAMQSRSAPDISLQSGRHMDVVRLNSALPGSFIDQSGVLVRTLHPGGAQLPRGPQDGRPFHPPGGPAPTGQRMLIQRVERPPLELLTGRTGPNSLPPPDIRTYLPPSIRSSFPPPGGNQLPLPHVVGPPIYELRPMPPQQQGPPPVGGLAHPSQPPPPLYRGPMPSQSVGPLLPREVMLLNPPPHNFLPPMIPALPLLPDAPPRSGIPLTPEQFYAEQERLKRQEKISQLKDGASRTRSDPMDDFERKLAEPRRPRKRSSTPPMRGSRSPRSPVLKSRSRSASLKRSPVQRRRTPTQPYIDALDDFERKLAEPRRPKKRQSKTPSRSPISSSRSRSGNKSPMRNRQRSGQRSFSRSHSRPRMTASRLSRSLSRSRHRSTSQSCAAPRGRHGSRSYSPHPIHASSHSRPIDSLARPLTNLSPRLNARQRPSSRQRSHSPPQKRSPRNRSQSQTIPHRSRSRKLTPSGGHDRFIGSQSRTPPLGKSRRPDARSFSPVPPQRTQGRSSRSRSRSKSDYTKEQLRRMNRSSSPSRRNKRPLTKSPAPRTRARSPPVSHSVKLLLHRSDKNSIDIPSSRRSHKDMHDAVADDRRYARANSRSPRHHPAGRKIREEYSPGMDAKNYGTSDYNAHRPGLQDYHRSIRDSYRADSRSSMMHPRDIGQHPAIAPRVIDPRAIDPRAIDPRNIDSRNIDPQILSMMYYHVMSSAKEYVDEKLAEKNSPHKSSRSPKSSQHRSQDHESRKRKHGDVDHERESSKKGDKSDRVFSENQSIKTVKSNAYDRHSREEIEIRKEKDRKKFGKGVLGADHDDKYVQREEMHDEVVHEKAARNGEDRERREKGGRRDKAEYHERERDLGDSSSTKDHDMEEKRHERKKTGETKRVLDSGDTIKRRRDEEVGPVERIKVGSDKHLIELERGKKSSVKTKENHLDVKKSRKKSAEEVPARSQSIEKSRSMEERDKEVEELQEHDIVASFDVIPDTPLPELMLQLEDVDFIEERNTTLDVAHSPNCEERGMVMPTNLIVLSAVSDSPGETEEHEQSLSVKDNIVTSEVNDAENDKIAVIAPLISGKLVEETISEIQRTATKSKNKSSSKSSTHVADADLLERHKKKSNKHSLEKNDSRYIEKKSSKPERRVELELAPVDVKEVDILVANVPEKSRWDTDETDSEMKSPVVVTRGKKDTNVAKSASDRADKALRQKSRTVTTVASPPPSIKSSVRRVSTDTHGSGVTLSVTVLGGNQKNVDYDSSAIRPRAERHSVSRDSSRDMSPQYGSRHSGGMVKAKKTKRSHEHHSMDDPKSKHSKLSSSTDRRSSKDEKSSSHHKKTDRGSPTEKELKKVISSSATTRRKVSLVENEDNFEPDYDEDYSEEEEMQGKERSRSHRRASVAEEPEGESYEDTSKSRHSKKKHKKTSGKKSKKHKKDKHADD